jgi:hypothetical protein
MGDIWVLRKAGSGSSWWISLGFGVGGVSRMKEFDIILSFESHIKLKSAKVSRLHFCATL